ncbi:DUF4145 domain-containing protein [Novacetimonas hansenii]|uniref:DUF4145 domain-containing protein n=1 Tax=Novacetimonas hansenii TaxID=436 RepID=UPI0009D6D3D1|nr:DUF4145 domain-containing protein [Novacetimonas hansenii]
MSFFSFRLKCPHCRSDSTFRIGSLFSPAECAEDAKYFSIAALCGHVTCYGPVGLRVEARNREMVWQAAFVICKGMHVTHGTPQDITPFIRILHQWPPEPMPDVPEFLPKKVANAFIQAEETRIAGQNLLSGIGYRTALDLATKGLGPLSDPNKIEMLGRRLGRLSDEGVLAPAIGEWAEHIGYLGNSSTHDGDELSNAELDDLANLTKMTLIYIVTLPETINRMRGEPTSDGGAIDPDSVAKKTARWLNFSPKLGRKKKK